MLVRNLLFKISSLMLVALFLVGLPASISAATDTWRPNLPAAGKGSVIWTNHLGLGGGLILDLEGTLYQVAPKTNDIPGRLQLDLAPGTYTYTASVPPIGAVTRTVEVTAGRVVNLSFAGRVEIKHDNHRGEDAAENQPAELQTYDEVLVYQEDVTNQAQ